MLSLGDLPLSRDDALVYPTSLRARNNAPLRSILPRVSSLSTGKDIQTYQVRDKDLFFMTETLRVSMYASALSSITPRCNLKATMVPVGPLHRRTRRTVGRLTGGSGVDMKDKSHKVGAFSSKSIVPCIPWRTSFPCRYHTILRKSSQGLSVVLSRTAESLGIKLNSIFCLRSTANQKTYRTLGDTSLNLAIPCVLLLMDTLFCLLQIFEVFPLIALYHNLR